MRNLFLKLWCFVVERLVGILAGLLVALLVIFVLVMFCETCTEWVGQRLGLHTKNPILKFLGIGMGGVLLALQALMSYKRAKALEDTAKAQAEAAKAQAKATEEQAKANQNTEQGRRQERLKNAIEHLGHASDSVRLGRAYELFHLAEDTRDLRQTVLDILCAHIRRTTGEDEYWEKYKPKPSEEIQSLLTLLFVQNMRRLEINCFGCSLHEYKKEIKGSTLLDRKRYKFAGQSGLLSDEERRNLCRSFLAKGRMKKKPSANEFAAYGQACLQMAQGTIALLRQHEAVLLASAIPRDVAKPSGYRVDNYLRKDIVFLLERFFYLLKEKREHGVIVMDETEKRQDRRFVTRLERYFTKTSEGQHRTEWIVPTPFFVSSDMTYAIQAADVCIYCINWGFRIPQRQMDAEHRAEIANMFGRALASLQFRGQRERNGRIFETYGIVYVSDPYEARPAP